MMRSTRFSRGAAALALGSLIVGCTVERAGAPVRNDAAAPPDGPAAAIPPRKLTQTSRLPVLFLTVSQPLKIRTDGKVPGTLKVVEDHDGTHAALETRPASYEGPIGINYRGDSSQDYPQKSYSIELRDAAGVQVRAPLLGLPADADFALVGCWVDKTCMRNALAYAMGRELGRWNPGLLFVEVYVDGVYNGLYQLVESIKTSRGRIDLPDPAPEGAGPELTGTYIFRREFWGKGKPDTKPPKDWLSPVKAPDETALQILYSYKDPDEDRITPAQAQYLTDHVASFEEMMKSPAWNDRAQGYWSWIDVGSWIDYALVNEVANNVDAYFKSAYFTKLRDANGKRGLLLMSPLWDFNIAFGNANYRDGWRLDNFIAWMNRFKGECTDFLPLAPACGGDRNNCFNEQRRLAGCYNMPYVPFYWQKLWDDSGFQDALKCRWQALRKGPDGPFSAEFIDARVREWSAALERAWPRHLERWSVLRRPVVSNPCEMARENGIVTDRYTDRYKQDGVPFPNCGPPAAPAADFMRYEAQWLVQWTKQRIAFLDRNLPGQCAAR